MEEGCRAEERSHGYCRREVGTESAPLIIGVIGGWRKLVIIKILQGQLTVQEYDYTYKRIRQQNVEDLRRQIVMAGDD